MDEPRQTAQKLSREKAYNAIKLRLSIADIVLNLVIIAILAFSGISPLIVDFLSRYITNDYVLFFFFVTAVGAIYSVLDFPF